MVRSMFLPWDQAFLLVMEALLAPRDRTWLVLVAHPMWRSLARHGYTRRGLFTSRLPRFHRQEALDPEEFKVR
ncbi:uncharacterized protein M421DRAFT_107010 [Didymella exigua CBS 183.55]|uniref:Uncharacterized protein n=1 Tax=Didymella exigua CBS 183.55 TaxID=1150837 RepID=A0A6A5S169_9PLEO|nr:uncharacterized protein M421DRAFT_107010 [Didymella exigua CBS 183.55]KAF1933872.1 hypothetical protein M421DRAFT_107010 [Didymella exigua CBS 183.55]